LGLGSCSISCTRKSTSSTSTSNSRSFRTRYRRRRRPQKHAAYCDKFADKDKYPDGVITRFDGQIYDVKPYVNLVAALWYNKDITDALGVTPPKTFDEVTRGAGQDRRG
jgi:Bacterial extracellular solute-binding protein